MHRLYLHPLLFALAQKEGGRRISKEFLLPCSIPIGISRYGVNPPKLYFATLRRATSHGIPKVQNPNIGKTNSCFTVISRTSPVGNFTFLRGIPILTNGSDNNSFYRVYPRGNFYLMIFPGSNNQGRFTKFWFPNCAAYTPCSKAGFCLCTTAPISIRS